MKLFFSPEYSGHIFARPEAGTVMMDTEVVGTMGLVQALELRLGLHVETSSRQQNLARYYDAMTRYMQSHPDNCLADSFKSSGLKTAEAAMDWRDKLRGACWDGKGAEISGRLKVLAEIEKLYRPDADKDLTDRVQTVIEELRKQKLDCSDTELMLNCNPDWLRPLEKSLVDALKERGTKVSLLPVANGEGSNLDIVRRMMTGEDTDPKELNANDDSLLIYRFADRQQANEYLASENLCGADVCIDPDNKALDHQLHLMGLPQSGSMARGSAPQLTQMLVLGIGLFQPRLNVNTLFQWLNMPLHPLGDFFRSRLADTVAQKGGYRNDSCIKLIEQYIDGDFVFLNEEQKALPEDEQLILRRKNSDRRKREVEIFLPPMQPVGSISRESLTNFTAALSSWCRQQHNLLGQKEDDRLWKEQLSKVLDMAETFSKLLETTQKETLDPKVVDSWLSTLDKTGDFDSSPDEKGSTVTVSHPAHVVSVANTTLWAGFDGEDRPQAECDFLLPSERKALSEQEHIRLWGDNENRYRDSQQLIPLLHTSRRLILVVCERKEGKPVAKHPLLIRLEQQFGEDASDTLKRIIVEPKISDSKVKAVEKVRNEKAKEILEFDHADKIVWPGHLSPSTFDKIEESPFDFFMGTILNIKPDENSTMKRLSTFKGDVAHAVIEEIFGPDNEKDIKTVDAIAAQINQHYDDIFNAHTDSTILMLPENRLEMNSMRIDLKRCLLTLLDIIKSNNLRVIGCETPAKARLGFGLPEETDPETGEVFDVKGNIDMVLEDADGHPVIFDLKWSSDAKKHREILERNGSFQLEFYRRMLRDQRDEVRKVAYFVMPHYGGRLYSLESFHGNNCIQVKPTEERNVIDYAVKLVNDCRESFENGQVEATTGKFSDYKLFVEETDQTKK